MSDPHNEPPTDLVPCESCGLQTEMADIYTAPDSAFMCEDCYSENVTDCHECAEGNYINALLYSDYCGGYLCEYCYDETHTYCDTCGETRHIDRPCGCSLHIKPYGYKPSPIFKQRQWLSKGRKMIGEPRPHNRRNRKLYAGIEMEVEVGSQSASNRAESLNLGESEAYIKEDGSLDNGFEIVSHPQTLHAWRQSKWLESVWDLRRKGCNSHNTSTCGLHISLSRRHFDRMELYRLSKFVYWNPYFIEVLSRRTRRNLISWGNPFALTDTRLDVPSPEFGQVKLEQGSPYFVNAMGEPIYTSRALARGYRNGRSTAVNLPSQRVELRFFRGTLKPSTFWADLEFSFSLAEFVKGHGLDDLHPLAFADWLCAKKYPSASQWITDNFTRPQLRAYRLYYNNNQTNETEVKKGQTLSQFSDFTTLTERSI